MASSRTMAANVVVGWMSNAVRVLLQLSMIPLMARLLGPEEMGLYTLTLPIMGFVMLLADGGLGNSLAREKLDNHRIWSTAFWALQAGGVFLAVAVSLSSLVVGYLAGQPRFPMVMSALSLTFLMVASAVIPVARLTQKGRLIVGPVADMIGNVIGAGLGVYCAFHGFGVWAMVIQYISAYGFRTLSFNIAEFYRPRFEFDVPGLKAHLMIGGAITGGKLFEVGARVLESIQISRTLGAGLLGAYGFANQVSRSLCEAASNSIWANLYYVSLHRDAETVRSTLVRLMRLLGMVLFPCCAMLAASSITLLPQLLGSKWADAEAPLAIMMATTPFSVIGAMTGAVVYGKGLVKVPFWVTVWASTARLTVVLFSPWIDINGICLGLGLISLGQGLTMVFATRHIIGHDPVALLRHLMWPFLLAVVCGVIFYAVLASSPNFLEIAAAAVACGGLYFAGLFVMDGRLFRADISSVTALIQKRA